MPMKLCDCCGQAVPEYGGIVADDDRGEIRFRGMAAVGLTGKEFSVFRFLLDKRGRTATKDAILDHLYQLQPNDEPDIKIVDVFVCKLRKKIVPLGLNIGTSWGRGYFLEAPAAEVDATSSLENDGPSSSETAGKTTIIAVHTPQPLFKTNDLGTAGSLIEDESAAKKAGL